MTRIFITGTAGAGKTTFAQRLAPILGLPAHSIDSFKWMAGWKTVPREVRLRRQQEIMAPDSWLIEGISAQIQEAADVVVFLDIPRPLAYLRVFRRNLPYLFRSRPGLPSGCPEILVIPHLVKFIWRYPRTHRAALLRQMADPSNRQILHHIRTDVGRDTLLRTLATRSAPSVRNAPQFDHEALPVVIDDACAVPLPQDLEAPGLSR